MVKDLQITVENTLWIIAVLSVAGFVIYSIMAWAPRFMEAKDFIVYDVNCYYDGGKVHLFATVKNTGNMPITLIKVELTGGESATVNINLKGGEIGALNDIEILGAGLSVGKVVGVKFTATFQDSTCKMRLIHVMLQEW